MKFLKKLKTNQMIRRLLCITCVAAVFVTGCSKDEGFKDSYNVYSSTLAQNVSSDTGSTSYFADDLCVTEDINYGTDQTDSWVAEGAGVFNLDTKQVLYSQNLFEKLYPASTTKIMTALIVIENCSLGDTVKVSPKAYGVEGSSMYLNAGEEVSVEDMLYGLMLLSGNDAAVALAIHTAGSVEAFAALMNARAEEIGAHNTHFVTPNGLHDPEHYTTAYDLALIAAEAMKNPDFRKIVGSTYHKTTTGSVIRYMKNKNKILWQYEGGCGVKTGFTKAAGRCLVFAAERDGMTLIGAVLSCPDMFNVAKAMLDYGFASFRTEKIISAGQSITRIRVSGGTKTALAAEAKDDIIIPVRIGESADIRTEVETRSGMNAPVEKGEDVGSVRVLMDGKLVGETRLLAAEDSLSLKFGQYLRKLLSGWAA